jgi:hypothetical protein
MQPATPAPLTCHHRSRTLRPRPSLGGLGDGDGGKIGAALLLGSKSGPDLITSVPQDNRDVFNCPRDRSGSFQIRIKSGPF